MAASILLAISLNPYPIELHVVCLDKLRNWHSSGPFEFHYSEHWRFSYEMNATLTLTQAMPKEDSDLTSHIKLLHVQGISIDGPPIARIFPDISDEEFLKIVQQEYQMCLTTMFEQPDYCILTIIRFWVFMIDRSLITKQEAVQAGKRFLPEVYHKLLDASFYDANHTFTDEDLQAFLQYVENHIPFKKINKSVGRELHDIVYRIAERVY
ncbi:aminoglycoside adenylyltransferase domain-containing protein [Bacillus daqingensis]